jgi:pimeloyl-ACP methyl ester carboxylesterase
MELAVRVAGAAAHATAAAAAGSKTEPHAEENAIPSAASSAVANEPGASRAYAYTGGKPFDPRRPTIVFLHGALHDHSVWTLLARWFAHHGYSVLALDLPGHGRSDGPPLRSIDALAGWLVRLLDAARVERAVVVGHSMGSLIALEVAGRIPDRVDHLVLMATAFPMSVSPALLALAADDPLQAIDRVNSFSHSTWAAKPGYPGPGSWTHGGNRALMRRVQAGGGDESLFLLDFQICDQYAGGLDAAERVACPSSVILGERDQMTPPAKAEALVRALRADVQTLAAGHALMAEAPEAALAALQQALAWPLVSAK